MIKHIKRTIGRIEYIIVGVLLGLLLAQPVGVTSTVPLYKFTKKTITSAPVVKERVVKVYPTSYRIQMLKDGKVVKEWKMARCKLNALTLTLVDEDGVEQKLVGDIRIVRE